MKEKRKKNILLTILIIGSLLLCSIITTANTSSIDFHQGFDKGPSILPVIPIRKTTFVNYDENSYLDDYAYLASVPTTVFKDNDKLYSNPLLFFQDDLDLEDEKDITMDSKKGINYLMEDWISYCDGEMDQMTLINVPKEKVKQWNAKEYQTINSEDPYELASQIALNDWSYSDKAIISVIEEEYNKDEIKTNEKTSGTLPYYKIETLDYNMKRPTIGIGGNYQPFKISDEKFKYLVAEAVWDDPSYEVDMQIYDDDIGLVSANMATSYNVGARETGGAYIRNYGDWEIGLTAFPKKGNVEENGKMNNMFQTEEIVQSGFFSKLFKKNTVDVTVKLLPGINVKIDEPVPYGCRDAEFTLSWDNNNVALGFAIIDPAGAEVATSVSRDEIIKGEVKTEDSYNHANVTIQSLGECTGEDRYHACVFCIGELTGPVDFEIEYNWKEKYNREEGEDLDSATNGAVLASQMNAPLLYVKHDEMPKVTKDALYQLGVKDVYILDFGNRLSNDVLDDLSDFNIKEKYRDVKKLYKEIINDKPEDIVFTTIEPWISWYVADLKPNGETKPGELFIGPAAYIAAHHETPVIIVDNHPELSQAIVYHKNFWGKKANHVTEPSYGDMVISGRQVYDFLDENGFDKKGDNREEAMETIITVAGQFNIGPTWDRTFVGKAIPGRFWFTPMDVSYWSIRDIFYPILIYENPAMDGKNSYINGSESEVQKGLIKGLLARFKEPKGVNLVTTKPSKEEEFSYPVLQSFVSGAYEFNQQAMDYWGCTYTRADGVTPYFDPSPDPIDNGATDRIGAYYPDLDDTNVVPFYANKAGYGNVFSTNFNAVVDNLNRGVLMFVQDSHGSHMGSGGVAFWNPDSPYIYEENPWRAYEPIMLKPGHLRTFVHFLFYLASDYGEKIGLPESSSSLFSKLADFRLTKLQLFSEVGSTENPDVAVLNPDLANFDKKFSKLTGGKIDILAALRYRVHLDRLFNNPDSLDIFASGDGMITSVKHSQSLTAIKFFDGYTFDESLDNLHSCGVQTVVCLPAGTFLQMSWIRHGISYTVMDPWGTSDYCAVWLQSIIKNLAMGDTIGQAYEKGIRSCAPELLVDHWWWDTWENVCFFGDPDLRVYVPSTEYSDNNHWTCEEIQALTYDSDLDINGHMPFGATSYPNQIKEKPIIPMWLIIIMLAILFLTISILLIKRGKKK